MRCLSLLLCPSTVSTPCGTIEQTVTAPEVLWGSPEPGPDPTPPRDVHPPAPCHARSDVTRLGHAPPPVAHYGGVASLSPASRPRGAGWGVARLRSAGRAGLQSRRRERNAVRPLRNRAGHGAAALGRGGQWGARRGGARVLRGGGASSEPCAAKERPPPSPLSGRRGL